MTNSIPKQKQLRLNSIIRIHAFNIELTGGVCTCGGFQTLQILASRGYHPTTHKVVASFDPFAQRDHPFTRRKVHESSLDQCLDGSSNE
ncbi:hypothetical protein DEO72_LG4g482 [Vigna unguiculata]|uniref:Uncharacterized protein n=1 Tax=Vigna unguiculata TaxID=3917 RepID=A0A4D6LMR4_VIGUN|nr:hypothetical protein DEO72_LG4g482 [Vigna unguiculata]